MSRPIDAYALNNALVSWYNDTEDATEKAVLRRVMQRVVHASTLPQPSNEALTPSELREMDEPVWVACKPIEGGNGYWCLCQHGHIITPAGSIYDVKEIPHWVFYRRPPEGEEDT